MHSKELIFFGRIAASFTHELKNVLAIVKETSGLMEDILSITREETFPHKERFSRAVATMLAQVGRGVELATRMNRFAHAPDHAVASVELNETVVQVTLLAERLARIKGVSIQAVPAPETVNLVSSPVGIQLTLFKAMECCWTCVESGSTLEVHVLTGPPAEVSFRCAGGLEGAEALVNRLGESAHWPELEEAARDIRATIRRDDAGFLFTVCFPGALDAG